MRVCMYIIIIICSVILHFNRPLHADFSWFILCLHHLCCNHLFQTMVEISQIISGLGLSSLAVYNKQTNKNIKAVHK